MATFEEGISETLALLRRKGGMTRSGIVAETGLSRSAVNQRIDALLAGKLVVGDVTDDRRQGRPAEVFSFNWTRGKLLAADVGVTKFRAGLCDLAGKVEAEIELPSALAEGPEHHLGLVLAAFEELLERTGTDADHILGVGLTLPAPVKLGSGMAVNPPIMPRWNRFDVLEWFGRRFSCPIFLEKDANAMAYGEARLAYPGVDELLFVKIGTGIGSGLVQDGRLFRGADGAAGDIGHVPLEDPDREPGAGAPLCKCGNTGCLEAYAGGWALLRDLQALGRDVSTVDDVTRLIVAADPTAVQMARRAGRLIGTALAAYVNLVNPRVVVLGGQLTSAGGDHVLPAIRERVYSRSLPLATASLSIDASTLQPRGGLVGLAHLIGDSILAPEQVGRLVTRT